MKLQENVELPGRQWRNWQLKWHIDEPEKNP
jgi:hypothetical protein